MANKKLMNGLFGRAAVLTHAPDNSWPLPSEFIGVEIEVENYDGDAVNLRPEWITHQDGSLRNGIEFVTAGPQAGESLTRAIDKFFSNRHTYSTSPRTSIHIHLNASDNMTVDQFRNMLVLMYVIEPGVFRWADDNRKWCGYCAPLTDIPPSRFINILCENANENKLVNAVRGEQNSDRYYGFNMAAFSKHGTVEFRYFPCTTERDKLISWIKLVMYVKGVARAFDGPAALLSAIDTTEKLEEFVRLWFPEIADEFLPHIDMADSRQRVRELQSVMAVEATRDNYAPPSISHRNPVFEQFVRNKFPQFANIFDSPEAIQARTAAATAAYEARRMEAMRALFGDDITALFNR